MKKLFVIVMVFVLSACNLWPERPVDMGVEFDTTTNQRIAFDTASGVDALTSRSVSVWFVADSTSAGVRYLSIFGDGGVTYSGYYLAINTAAAGDVAYGEGFTTLAGQWYTAGTVITAGQLTNITVTYAMTTATDPIIYVNGVAKSTAELTTPAGTINQNDKTMYVGASNGSGLKPLDGKIFDLKMYNRILTPAEVLDLYNSRCKIVNDNGLVFHADLNGAAGLQNFDGSTLGAANVFTDRIGGARGVPAGNPVGYADNALSCGGW